MARAVKPASQVQSATNVSGPLSADIDLRTKRYAIQMGIRVVCFILAILTPAPWRWIFLAGAVVLPYVAVIGANTPTKETNTTPLGLTPPALPATKTPPSTQEPLP